jgi:Carboxypeptidase regulatory-like domain/TonB dependent receptor/TonB-dependent Receptor Plug Domain
MAGRRIVLSWLFVFGVLAFSTSAHATIFGNVRGIVHDPQHRPIKGATVTIKAASTDWQQTLQTDNDGAFLLQAVPLGEYTIKVTGAGFAPQEQHAIVNSGTMTDLHFQLSVASTNETVEVTDIAGVVNPQSSTSETLISRSEIASNPGADRTNSLQMITNFVPGAYMVHDLLHIRGGHQVSWLIDGVPVPNTNIASNVAPQFDPKDIDTLEVGRGGYSAESGDRTYGVFNVVPRSGFERNNEGELLLNYGSFNSTNDQISFGSHTQRFAYYASLNGTRSELGLDTPIAHVIHDKEDGGGAFLSLIFNPDPSNQLRLVTSGRADHYQIPNDFDMENTFGIRDVQNEHDAFGSASWLHTFPNGILLSFSPFFHANRAAYVGGVNDQPVTPNESTKSIYAGGQVIVEVVRGNNNLRAGFVGFAQRDKEFFGVVANDGSGTFLSELAQPSADNEAVSRFSGAVNEHSTDPRIGAAIQLPRIHWVLHGFYGRYYQAPPLNTFSGTQLCPVNLSINFQCLSLLDLANQSGFGFLPLPGERDEQYEAGLSIPVQRWALDFTTFRTHAKNFLDHDVIGNSGIFFPLTLDRARIRGWESTVRSPRLFERAQLHLAYSHQFAEGKGARTGGLTDFSPPHDLFFLDHDQRDTLSVGYDVRLPWRSFSSGNFNYGKGFLNGIGPGHLHPHATFDFALGKSFGENWTAQFSTLNVSNNRYLLDTSNTFGGTHFYEPRQYSVELRYKFHY